MKEEKDEVEEGILSIHTLSKPLSANPGHKLHYRPNRAIRNKIGQSGPCTYPTSQSGPNQSH